MNDDSKTSRGLSEVEVLTPEDFESCPSCYGHGLVIGNDGDPSLCYECKGDTVILKEKINL